MISSDEIYKSFPRGTKLTVIVKSHAPFGIFVQILGVEISALVERPALKFPDEYPQIGTELEAFVLYFRDPKSPNFQRQLRLSLDPVILANLDLLEPTDN